jgi:putative transposase
MERFFRSLKTEWIPTTGYQSFSQAKTNIIDYIIGYYSQVRPHQHNNGFAPNVAEKNYWAEYKTVAKILDHYKHEKPEHSRMIPRGCNKG